MRILSFSLSLLIWHRHYYTNNIEFSISLLCYMLQLQSKMDTFLGEQFNCTDSQLQGLKAFIEVHLGAKKVVDKLIHVFIQNREPNHKVNRRAWINRHFDCSNEDDVAIRSKLVQAGLVTGIQCS